MTELQGKDPFKVVSMAVGLPDWQAGPSGSEVCALSTVPYLPPQRPPAVVSRAVLKSRSQRVVGNHHSFGHWF